jgi:hypothetical protein
MAQTVEGGKKCAQTNIKKYGKDFYKNIGAIGGRAKVPKGFAISGKAREAGAKGGSVSRRYKTAQ